MSTFSTIIQYSSEVLATVFKQEKEINDIQNGKEVTLSLVIGGMKIYTLSEDSTKILLETINQ